MMPERIRSLTIAGFRGASRQFELVLDDGKPMTLIFGENGTGKSTIVDAIECVGTKSTSFLDSWKLGKGRRKESYIPTLGMGLDDVKIEMQLGPHTCTATLDKSGISVDGRPPRPPIKILRRKSLQAFIEADAAHRYEKVADFLDIPQVDRAEASLRAAAKAAADTFDAATQASAQAQEYIYRQWEQAGCPGGEASPDAALAWARERAQADPQALLDRRDELNRRIRATDTLLQKAADLQQAEAALLVAQQREKSANQTLGKLEAESQHGNAALMAVLRDAKQFLDSNAKETVCPVCEETTIVPAQLSQRLGQRLAAMEQLSTAETARSNAAQTLASASDRQAQAQQALLKAAAEYVGVLDVPPMTAEELTALVESDSSQAVERVRGLMDQERQRLPELRQQVEALSQQQSQLNSIRLSLDTLDEKTAEAQARQAARDRLRRAVEVFESHRKAFISGVLNEIANEVDALYQQIHPNEALGGLSFKLDDRLRGSLHYGVAFAEQADQPPQPYYSESHLDTLGLCIFLALAQRFGDDCIVVLDDVLGSVDQQHLARTLDMLSGFAESIGQLILTTHYRPLRDRFRFGQNAGGKISLRQLKPWTLEQGIRIGETLQYRDELRARLAEDDFSHDVVASQAGILFESLLGFITLTYRCKVPHLPEPRYTFGDLTSAINGKLKQALCIEQPGADDACIEIPLAPILERLGHAIQVRNLVGCHFNQWAGELADVDVRDMAELALELADALICPNCGSLPKSDKSGDHWDCGGSCKQTHMRPLQAPK